MTLLGLLLAVVTSCISQLVVGQGFATLCNVQTFDFQPTWLGMYCNNLNTAEYGYNWTW